MTRDPKHNADRLSWKFWNSICNARDERLMDLHIEGLDTEKILNAAEFQGKALFGGVKDIMSHKSVGDMKRLLKHMFDDNESNEHVSITLAAFEVLDELVGTHVVEMQTAAEDRILKLLVLSQDHSVDWRTSRYLRMVAQAFLFGRDEECVILCRSVLEAAYDEAVTDDECRKHPRPGGSGLPPFGLADRLHAAESSELLSADHSTRAGKVKNRANDVLHPGRAHAPAINEEEAWKLLVSTVVVVKKLSSGNP